MNKELLDKLKFQAASQVSPLLEGKEWQQVYSEKFTELIVRECVAEARDDCAGWTERDQCLVMQVMDRIMLHFGVEE